MSTELNRHAPQLTPTVGRYFKMLTHYYAWKNNPKRATLYRRECRILARGAMNSILIEFADGQRECVSRNSVRVQ